MNQLIVQKYGGSSVATATRILRVAANIKQYCLAGNRLVVIVSAMNGETNRLIDLAHEITTTPDKKFLDLMQATGEQVTVGLLGMALTKIGIKSQGLLGLQIPIITTNEFNNARIIKINSQYIFELFNNYQVLIVAGFQGISQQGELTTLGRGGSDATALALAVSLNVDNCQIYTDVVGVYNLDPKQYQNAQVYEQISGIEMLEMASLGAKVLQVRSCELAYRYHCNIQVLSSFDYQHPGTLIMNQSSELENYPIISYTSQKFCNLIKFCSAEINTLLAQLYQIIEIDMLQINFPQVLFCINDKDKTKVLATISKEEKLEIITGLTKISVIGSGFRSNSVLNAKIWQLLEGIKIVAMTHNEISLSILIDQKDEKLCLTKLNAGLSDT